MIRIFLISSRRGKVGCSLASNRANWVSGSVRSTKFPEVNPDLAVIQGLIEAVLALMTIILLFAAAVVRFRLRVTKSAFLPHGRGKGISYRKFSPG